MHIVIHYSLNTQGDCTGGVRISICEVLWWRYVKVRPLDGTKEFFESVVACS